MVFFFSPLSAGPAPPALGKQIEPENLEALKKEIARRWGVIDLLDLIKNVDHATAFTGEFTSSMIEGLLRHLTSAEVDRQYTALEQQPNGQSR